jgi:hypothetical protein
MKPHKPFFKKPLVYIPLAIVAFLVVAGTTYILLVATQPAPRAESTVEDTPQSEMQQLKNSIVENIESGDLDTAEQAINQALETERAAYPNEETPETQDLEGLLQTVERQRAINAPSLPPAEDSVAPVVPSGECSPTSEIACNTPGRAE